MIYDITPPITVAGTGGTASRGLGVWPGDTPPTREVLCSIEQGAAVTLSTLRATVHLGAHADGPNHYAPAPAPGVGERSLEYYLGPCQVIEARVVRGARVALKDLVLPAASAQAAHGGITQRRILIRTNTFPDPNAFNEDFAALDPALIEWLAAPPRRVMTIGIDTPSVDLIDSKDLPSHKAVLRNDMAILEGLVLKDVPAGEYELIALPLKLMGFDASPVRAVLRRV